MMNDLHPFSRTVSRDESVYPNPGAFNPDRFAEDGGINLKVQDPEKFMPDHGRRNASKCLATYHYRSLPWKTFCDPRAFYHRFLYDHHV